MSVRSEYDGEENPLGRELREQDDEESFERLGLQPEDNELHAPGQVCARCGKVMTAREDVRLGADGHFVHETCP
jgi:hypothetical protein